MFVIHVNGTCKCVKNDINTIQYGQEVKRTYLLKKTVSVINMSNTHFYVNYISSPTGRDYFSSCLCVGYTLMSWSAYKQAT